jgi:hypothetical protein
MSHMNRILGIDLAAMTFTAQSGLQIYDAAATLRRLNLQLITNVEIGNMTRGAAACCQSKDGLDGGEVNATSPRSNGYCRLESFRSFRHRPAGNAARGSFKLWPLRRGL